jgi:hypothetical protein
MVVDGRSNESVVDKCRQCSHLLVKSMAWVWHTVCNSISRYPSLRIAKTNLSFGLRRCPLHVACSCCKISSSSPFSSCHHCSCVKSKHVPKAVRSRNGLSRQQFICFHHMSPMPRFFWCRRNSSLFLQRFLQWEYARRAELDRPQHQSTSPRQPQRYLIGFASLP